MTMFTLLFKYYICKIIVWVNTRYSKTSIFSICTAYFHTFSLWWHILCLIVSLFLLVTLLRVLWSYCSCLRIFRETTSRVFINLPSLYISFAVFPWYSSKLLVFETSFDGLCEKQNGWEFLKLWLEQAF